MTAVDWPEIPPATWRDPLCSICEEELVDLGDFWVCDLCGLQWDLEDTTGIGEFETDEPRCGQEHRPYEDDGYTIDDLFKGAVYRCIRPKGHEDRRCAGIKVAGIERITKTLTWRTKGGAS